MTWRLADGEIKIGASVFRKALEIGCAPQFITETVVQSHGVTHEEMSQACYWLDNESNLWHFHPVWWKEKQKENEMTKKNDLFEIEISPNVKKYGHYLATNSAGQMVFEVKGTGDVIAVDKDRAERVMPYTVDIHFLHNGSFAKTDPKSYAYLSEKGKVSEGDLLLVNNSLARVVAVDTKSELATTVLTGWKLTTETI